MWSEQVIGFHILTKLKKKIKGGNFGDKRLKKKKKKELVKW